MKTLTIDGASFDFPETGDKNWGDAATDAITELADKSLYPSDVIDDLVSDDTDMPLSAAQGKALKTSVDGKIAKITSPTADNLPKITVDGQLSDSGFSIASIGDVVWNEITTDEAMQPGYGYIVNSSSIVILTLPTTCAKGKKIKIVGMGSGVWRIAQNASQSIKMSLNELNTAIQTTVGTSGRLEAVHPLTCVDIICTVADTTFEVVSHQGTLSFTGNYFGDLSDGDFTSTGGGGDTFASTTDGDMVVKNFNDVTINSGHTVTVANRCKGLWIYANGNVSVAGTLTMTAKGAQGTVSAGDDPIIYRLKAGESESGSTNMQALFGTKITSAESNQPAAVSNGKSFIIARAGGAGGASDSPGNTAANGMGGGGGGGSTVGKVGGAGAAGNCYHGGAAGGGGGGSAEEAGQAAAADGTGGRGGDSFVSNCGGSGGGAGTTGGRAGLPSGAGAVGGVGSTGAAGLLVLIARGNVTIESGGVISSNGYVGGAGGAGVSAPSNGSGGGGGGSGGGRVIILCGGTFTNSGTLECSAGAGGAAGYSTTYPGQAGGAGEYTTEDGIDA